MRRIERFFERLAAVQTRRAGTIVVLALLVGAASVPLVARLGLDSSMKALLPEDKPSVRDLRKIEDRVGGLNTLTVAIRSESSELEAMQRLARDLVPRLERLPDRLAHAVDWNVGVFEDFVWDQRHLYADLETLQRIHDQLDERIAYEKKQGNPFYVDVSDEKPPKPGELVDELVAEAEAKRDEMAKYPGGFYVHEEGDLLAIFVRSGLGAGDVSGIRELTSRIRDHVRELDPSSYGEDLRVDFAGNLIMAREEQQALMSELGWALGVTVTGVLLVIYLFFWRLRALPLIGGSLLVPVLVTFAVGALAVGSLNLSTAFLGSIVVGNGINPNVIWLARYFEERRRGARVGEAVRSTHLGTWAATLTASMAAAIAYASLVLTDFRGFHDFGIIGGTGMALCWVGALVVLPAFTVLVERMRELRPAGRLGARQGRYAEGFSRLAHGAPRTVVAVSALLGVAALALSAWAVAQDPIEYDFRNLTSERDESTEAKRINDRVGTIVESSSQGNGIAVVLDSREEARWLEEELEAKMRRAEDPVWKDVHSLYDRLPDRQDEKIELLSRIRPQLEEVRPDADPEAKERIDEHMPPAELSPLGPDDLPEKVARPFTEQDGTRGRILVVQKSEWPIWDGRYLVRWARELREVELPDGDSPPLAGRAPIFADVIRAVWEDGPVAVGASFTATLLLLLVAFRGLWPRLLTLLALLLGIVWLGGSMTVAAIKLNFLNFIAFPITFGNGADYGVNVMRRYVHERRAGRSGAVRAAIKESGGAVTLCSLTTIIGYTSLYVSSNQALNSFGSAMAISEVTCLLAAAVTMPAVLLLLQRRGVRIVPGASDEPAEASSTDGPSADEDPTAAPAARSAS